MKTATIQHAAGDGTWESPYGLMYSYELHLSNGDHIKVNAKKPTRSLLVNRSTMSSPAKQIAIRRPWLRS